MINYSVLMSVYKKEKPEFLEQSIVSILNQTYKTNDFVIVKDGELTDELNDVIDKYSVNYDCIHVLTLEKNVGLGLALNEGLKKCRNELVARMDSDDISKLDRCEKQIKRFRENNELEILGAYVEEFCDSPDKIISVKKVPCTNEEIYNFGRRRNPFSHPTVMYKKSVILQNNGYKNLRLGQDFELFTRLIRKGCYCENIDQSLLKFRRNIDANKRRKNWNSVKSNINIVWQSRKEKYSRNSDLIYVVGTQLALYILPNKLIDIVYSKYFRENL